MFDRGFLQDQGFRGFRSFAELREDAMSMIPDGPGTYVVLREETAQPAFLQVSAGGHFKGKDPTVPIATLEAKWILGCPTIYIGKADRLRRRLKQFADFGEGKPVGHWGGRYVWQVEGSSEFLVAWLPCGADQTARQVESELLREFADERSGLFPFANLRW